MSTRSAVVLVGLIAFASACGADTSDPDGGKTTDAGRATDGGGAALGAACDSDARCQSQFCECVDFDCNTRVCAQNDCLCGYGTSGSCAGPLRSGSKDPDDCDGASVSCFTMNDCH